MKTCTRCNEEKPEEEFYLVKSGRRTGCRVAHCKSCDRDLWFIRNYGITQERYREILASQGGVCAICERPETLRAYGRERRLSVDHDHACCPGKTSCGDCVRGLLCNDCNTILGRARDAAATLRAAADYLESRPSLSPVH